MRGLILLLAALTWLVWTVTYIAPSPQPVSMQSVYQDMTRAMYSWVMP